jgi:anti-sigma factor RsiW
MNCTQAQQLFSPYLDGVVSGVQMQSLDRHMRQCVECHSQYNSLQQTQQMLALAGRRKPPAEMALKIRLAASREAARARRWRWEGVHVRLQNVLNAFMVPATAGLMTAVTVFAMLMGYLAPLQAGNPDVPLLVYTAPQLQQSAFATGIESINSDSLVIEAYVDSVGRVQDYRILSEPPESQQLLPQVKNMLIFTTFRPATNLGRPTAGRAVLSFSKISVRG